MMQKYHTDTHGPDTDAVKRAILHALQLANDCRQILFVNHTLENFNSQIISDVLGESVIKLLIKNKSAPFKNVTLFIETEKTKSSFKLGPAICAFVSSKILKNAMNDNRIVDVIYVPWTEDELNSYKAKNPDSTAI